MQSNRSWREWARRWGLERLAGNLAVDDTVQPVVILDDVSSLSLPPVTDIWGFRTQVTAVAGQYSQLIVQPTTMPIIIMDIRTPHQPTYGVTDGDASTILAAVVPVKNQGPIGAVMDAVVRAGTSVTSVLVGVDGPTLGGSGVETAAVGLIILPGQFFWSSSGSFATTIEWARVRFLEVPASGDAHYTSLPRT